jgi:predicted Zn-ribbon and HTH transcriptional regulator
MDRDNPRRLKEKIISVLELQKSPSKLSEISHRTGISVNRCQTILDELSESEKIVREIDGGYGLSLGNLEGEARHKLGVCNNCGLFCGTCETMFEVSWLRYEGNQLRGTGSVRYCKECAPSEMLLQDSVSVVSKEDESSESVTFLKECEDERN